ncbi:pantoate--beta-alanine ligase [Microbulbifer thermotolerans]|uniref:Pantothenate synthetase n=1 Tax=Microbulbifer thermotolerans TaxID=252514 RepID=A0A143HI81_MICTH|nr:pantoate--beta-alanine ligase [Microbulbifer thermotolerans]AMX01424.1 pantoate--beta-alanine ligase [Microbulbifer thermotolerans]MCX2778260.1 pantoate--beta-alanine ligase [Microbulbifer thermotolerans]MCX2782017.1 pantoate--beta-alanine ligase [Microbulbifer thermotolerans]MCX2783225.1 pantoate--beta-alanine ligase [Microbulbifer thermotolerans]MCX2795594.1 pantoate--beta-alanine ligase [Microbulbifer thermotolerans]
MQVFHHVASLRDALAKARSDGKTVAFVPTMGNLHDAHIELVKTAQQHCDLVVVSIFVNRLQFGLNEDWDKYPRTMEQDMARLRAVQCDFLFHPEESEIYPNGMDEQTRVICPAMTDILCGASRPGHFEGVTTVVAKLFNIVQPDKAVFGIKDFQQLAVIRRMVEDLCIPVEVIAAPVHREPDGLAMSSRNSYITAQERPKVPVLYQTLLWAKGEIEGGRRDFAVLEDEAKQRIEKAGFRVDYFSIRNSKDLQPAADDDSEITILGAIYTSAARLIDNLSLEL